MGENKVIKYFGFGTNKDFDMMSHMVGNKALKGEHGRLIGFEVCIQKPHHFRKDIPITSPLFKQKLTPEDIIISSWGPDFSMYVSRQNPTGVAYGTIWDLTPEEMALVTEWEMVEYGCQENVKGIAVTDDGRLVEVLTQSFANPAQAEVESVVLGDDYEPYIADKKAMLDKADKNRELFLKFGNRQPWASEK